MMSLKAFHVVFIIASLLLTLGFGWWCLREAHGSRGMQLAAGGAFAIAVVIVVYGVWFLRKLRKVSFL